MKTGKNIVGYLCTKMYTDMTEILRLSVKKSRYYGDLVGYFVVKYKDPSVFPMPIEEVHSTEFSQAWNILEKGGHIERNDLGVPFWKD
ncbi:hypothetical protein [Selenomonas ruminantium]|uniref:hypothetical protein n=1 Tax=Selenomonas ruminantium TaxID=971 RepID=UPI0026EAE089|nr:hypothetical protein [Selenomonas ruminantium]